MMVRFKISKVQGNISVDDLPEPLRATSSTITEGKSTDGLYVAVETVSELFEIMRTFGHSLIIHRDSEYAHNGNHIEIYNGYTE